MDQILLDRQPNVTASGITGALNITKTGTTARTVTFPDAAITVARSDAAQTFTGLQTFSAGVACTTLTASGQMSLSSTPFSVKTAFGYNHPAYPVIFIGSSGASVASIALNVDPAAVAGGSFVGNGTEILLRRSTAFLQPTSGGTDWEYASVTFGELTLMRGSAPGTPGATEVLIGAGQIKAGAGISCVGLTVSASNIATDTTTGMKVGTATGQKIGFWNATPIAQPASANQAAVATTGATNITPYGFTSAAQADAIVTLVNQLRSDLVAAGLIKGAA